MEVSLPSVSWRGKGSAGPISHLLDWERGCFRGLAHLNSASKLVSTHLAQVWPSPAPPVSIGAGVSEQEGPATGVSSTGGSSAGAVVAPILGPLLGPQLICTIPHETRWALAGATWVTVPQSNGGTSGLGLAQPTTRENNSLS